jgi:hypothetical protein
VTAARHSGLLGQDRRISRVAPPGIEGIDCDQDCAEDDWSVEQRQGGEADEVVELGGPVGKMGEDTSPPRIRMAKIGM